MESYEALLARIQAKRVQDGRMSVGFAAYSDSDMFKTNTSTKPLAKDFSAHFSAESSLRTHSVLKQAAAKHLKTPGLVSLGGGLPSSEYFPFSEISLRIPDPSTDSCAPDHDVTISKHDSRIGASEYDLSLALNYGQPMGSPQMLRWITEHTEMLFNPPYADWRACQTVGNTGALEQAIRLLCDRERGDSILMEEYSFSTAIETIAPQGIKMFGVKMDAEGLLPDSMDQMLRNWDAKTRGARKPHVLYTIPTGQNPTGTTMSLERRQAVYAVCQEHDIFIIEDDPYYFLQMQDQFDGRGIDDDDKSAQKYFENLVPTFLSLDTDGRVLRMDSFSKVVVPGARLGWVTASAQVIERFLAHAEVANQGPGGFSQLMLWKLLDETWGHDGYMKWLCQMSKHYQRRRDVLLNACEEFLPRDIVTWDVPQAGMFIWIKVQHQKCSNTIESTAIELEEKIFDHAIANGVLCARGSWFRVDSQKPLQEIFFRITFASAEEETMKVAIQRLSAAIRQSFGTEK
ncbi:hypothetical protein PFICI_07657 [Pestalotiopsis fici W106-1]|uniref:aromatic-amino-acid transaminase n=1 Tax=Pestalotiopsis fici (strain W106-1 / CGMCC3.15140) TaxID=1229662 RepID=W3X1X0_PESFW|nr:uncharacterized protein PFICI_07657 [Pestalotiopsis fici W106-1]ETS80128.1 hypothetical protein PFICI_07657 [Pestalotiopsis fici W106-1]